jgi:hypothetical protein
MPTNRPSKVAEPRHHNKDSVTRSLHQKDANFQNRETRPPVLSYFEMVAFGFSLAVRRAEYDGHDGKAPTDDKGFQP